ncbi:MAG: phosphopantothenoylcysteine decarboxylase [Planctomycetales bacterium]
MRILITAGPTREYIDQVRYLSNASSGQMGFALAEAALQAGHDVTLICGPVHIPYPAGCRLIKVERTAEMLDACLREFPNCDGVIGTAAVCDYTPKFPSQGKLAKTGKPLLLELIQTPDILAALGKVKGNRWSLGFALEAESGHAHALVKMEEKNCDAIVLNGPGAIGSAENSIHLIDRTGKVSLERSGTKVQLAGEIIGWIATHLAK